MAGNELMQKMLHFSVKNVNGVSCFECDYHYTLGKRLSQLEEYPKGSCFYVINEGGPGIRHLLEPVSGWRIKVGDYYLYLLIGGEDVMSEAGRAQIPKLHRLLMSEKWYYAAQDDIIQYWTSPGDKENNPEDYLIPEERSALLVGVIEKTGESIESALELGCNIGRNLNYLKREMGITVGGLEINEAAVGLLRDNYPDLAQSPVLLGDLTRTIHKLEDRSYDLVFSMAVLMHLHPDIEDVFWDKVSTVARKLIITIENESQGSLRNWPRNYKTLFEPRGWKEILYHYPLKGLGALEGYTIRAFVLK